MHYNVNQLTMHDQDYLKLALHLACKRRGFCAPNPAVGAIVVKQGQILASGYHFAAGHAHAEAAALAQIDEQSARGATLYVTLEPCCIWQRTPPCTQLLIERGIARVVYGLSDPNPKVAGQGIAQLQAAGINCTQIRLPAIDDFYQAYHYWQRTGLPWVTTKLAVSADEKYAGVQGQRIQITSERLNVFTQQQRFAADALLTSARTVLNDDPQMNVRLAGECYAKPLYVLDRELQVHTTARIFTTASQVTLFHHLSDDHARVKHFTKQGVKCVAMLCADYGLAWPAILAYIGELGCHSLWVEAGAQCLQSLLVEQGVNKAIIYQSERKLGNDALSAQAYLYNLQVKAQRQTSDSLPGECIHTYLL